MKQIKTWLTHSHRVTDKKYKHIEQHLERHFLHFLMYQYKSRKTSVSVTISKEIKQKYKVRPLRPACHLRRKKSNRSPPKAPNSKTPLILNQESIPKEPRVTPTNNTLTTSIAQNSLSRNSMGSPSTQNADGPSIHNTRTVLAKLICRKG